MTNSGRPTGLYFEEFQLNATFNSRGRTITETDIVNFAGLSGDYNPMHTDAEYASKTMFGERVAHGMLGLSIAVGALSLYGGDATDTTKTVKAKKTKAAKTVKAAKKTAPVAPKQ